MITLTLLICTIMLLLSLVVPGIGARTSDGVFWLLFAAATGIVLALYWLMQQWFRR